MICIKSIKNVRLFLIRCLKLVDKTAQHVHEKKLSNSIAMSFYRVSFILLFILIKFSSSSKECNFVINSIQAITYASKNTMMMILNETSLYIIPFKSLDTKHFLKQDNHCLYMYYRGDWRLYHKLKPIADQMSDDDRLVQLNIFFDYVHAIINCSKTGWSLRQISSMEDDPTTKRNVALYGAFGQFVIWQWNQNFIWHWKPLPIEELFNDAYSVTHGFFGNIVQVDDHNYNFSLIEVRKHMFQEYNNSLVNYLPAFGYTFYTDIWNLFYINWPTKSVYHFKFHEYQFGNGKDSLEDSQTTFKLTIIPIHNFFKCSRDEPIESTVPDNILLWSYTALILSFILLCGSCSAFIFVSRKNGGYFKMNMKSKMINFKSIEKYSLSNVDSTQVITELSNSPTSTHGIEDARNNFRQTTILSSNIVNENVKHSPAKTVHSSNVKPSSLAKPNSTLSRSSGPPINFNVGTAIRNNSSRSLISDNRKNYLLNSSLDKKSTKNGLK
ncbi:hypothetical protein RDWZM_009694 [Blomia tropicalis]|uniref:Uncharacterized protein n=1 Tax=Blomia tropicalis TaxID=40697 RepID=A0A9Q0M6T0_BLOTA|nr:hypothetical protein RDWZM_009694 [Blomia tropicalis]